MTRQELDVDALPKQNGRAPNYAYRLHSQPANLTVSVLNYGERQPGAETIHIRFSRPVDGCDCLTTTNGNAIFSASGTRLLLHDLFLVIAIDTATMKLWHFALPTRTLFLSVDWEGEAIVGMTLGYSRPVSDAEPFGPWSWVKIEQEWQTGLGKWLITSPCA